MLKTGLKRSLPLTVLLTGVAILITGCGSTGLDGKFIWLPESIEIGYGEKVDEQWRNQYRFIEDPVLVGYINEVGDKVAVHSHRPGLDYTFRILDDPEINAFSAPGGFVYVTSGALEALEDEAQLASLLGHEIAHVALYHGAEGAQWDILLLVMSGYFEQDEVDLVDAGYDIATLGYGRENELSADYWGTTYAAAAGYDPRGMVGFLEIVKSVEVREGFTIPTFLSTHPDTDDRIKNLNRYIDVKSAENYGVRNGERYREIVCFGNTPNDSTGGAITDKTSTGDNGGTVTCDNPEPTAAGDDYSVYGEDWYIGF